MLMTEQGSVEGLMKFRFWGNFQRKETKTPKFFQKFLLN